MKVAKTADASGTTPLKAEEETVGGGTVTPATATPVMVRLVTATPVAPCETKYLFRRLTNALLTNAYELKVFSALATEVALAAEGAATVKATATPACSRWRPVMVTAVMLVIVTALVDTPVKLATAATNAARAAVVLI